MQEKELKATETLEAGTYEIIKNVFRLKKTNFLTGLIL